MRSIARLSHRDVGRHSYADRAAALRQYGADPLKDLLELYRRMVFNILVTNDDDHLRNHGFLYEAKGWRLSPLYDVVPKPLVGTERTLVLGGGPHGRAATLDNAIAGAGAFGLAAEQARHEAQTLAGHVWGPGLRSTPSAAYGRPIEVVSQLVFGRPIQRLRPEPHRRRRSL